MHKLSTLLEPTRSNAATALVLLAAFVLVAVAGCGPSTPVTTPIESRPLETSPVETSPVETSPVETSPGPEEASDSSGGGSSEQLGEIAFERWDCLSVCGRTGTCPQPGSFFEPFEGNQRAFETRFGCSTGIDFESQRPYAFAVGGSNRFPKLDGVHRTEDSIEVRVTVTGTCQGAETYGRLLYVLLLPQGEQPIKLVSTTNVPSCGSRPPP